MSQVEEISVIAPVCIIKDKLHDELGLFVGVTTQSNTAGQPFIGVHRGFLDPKEKHYEAVSGELFAQTGYMFQLDKRLFSLAKKPVRISETDGKSAEEGKAIEARLYGLQLRPFELQHTPEGLIFRQGIIRPISQVFTDLLKSRFIDSERASKLPDRLTQVTVEYLRRILEW